MNLQYNNRKTILVVDDEESIRMLIVSLLEQDYNIITVSDGEEALDYMNKGYQLDLILLDMEMPNLNGRALLRRIRFDPRHANTPVFFVTSLNSSLITNSVSKMGVTGFIYKPFKSEELVATIHEFFNNLSI
jgi:two-component system, chemotaxis family, chemotaxis protein CheY